MNAKLRALLAFVGTLTIGGVGYTLLQIKPGVTRLEAVDAGLLGFCDPGLVECQVRLAPACRDLPDGGLRPRYATLRTKALVCDRDAGTQGLLFRWPRQQGSECYEVAGDPTDSCAVVELGTCTDGTVCAEDSSGEQPVRGVVGRCACRAPSLGLCRVPNPDGGTPILAPLGVTIRPPFSGAGCVEKVCSIYNGDQGQDWPDTCPQ